MDSLTLTKFKSRFIEAGRVLSLVETKKQRVLGRLESVTYVALYDSLQDKWALVRNKNAGYPCYSLDSKGNPIAIYLDRLGNIKERTLKQDLFMQILETSEGSQEFRENLRVQQNALKHNYSLSFVKPSLGYNLDIPTSCQKGRGSFFKWVDEIAKMAILMDNNGKIVARCLIWDKNYITHNGEACLNDVADRLYYNEGIHHLALKNELKKLDIDCIWEKAGDRPFDYAEYILNLPEEIKEELDNAIWGSKAPFMDTFSHYNSGRGVLYSFHWPDRLDYDSFEWDDSVDNVLLYTDGSVYNEDDDDRVWDDYNEERIDRDYAVEPINYGGVTHMDSCIYSDYHQAYILDDSDAIAVHTPGRYVEYDYTYRGSGVELVEINDEVYFLDSLSTYRA
ncbi:hypothetical protein CVIC12175_1338 [Campylobacter vicugnae]|uniref:hypothetical protein n=1 Tax=Campylobacter vicugnae TaxID=1660076 RepID=UPI000A2FA74B|nr:hypothetical protein [Campylobacter sp. RM12175]ARR04440.1 hypothetical protein CVIC12175_1338 [Campylobacter sp. RM12175]